MALTRAAGTSFLRVYRGIVVILGALWSYVTGANEVVTTCCSDALTRTASMSAELRLQCLRNLTDLLSRTFKEQFVFPALGHEDLGVSFSQLAALWQQWLPQEALDTFETGG